MESWLEDGDTVVLEHVQQGGLASIIETEEEEFGVFVGQAELGEDIPDYSTTLSVFRHVVWRVKIARLMVETYTSQ